MNYREIEEDMREEYLAAIETGLFQAVLFNYDEWLAGDGLRIRLDGMISNPVVYRGWMLKPNEYEKLCCFILSCFPPLVKEIRPVKRPQGTGNGVRALPDIRTA